MYFAGSSAIIPMEGQSEHVFKSPSSASKLGQIISPYFVGFIWNTPYDAIGPLYVVCMLGELKYHIQGIDV